jgi:hypothetical protein
LDNLKIKLLFESSPWYLALCLLAGVVYAYILYRKKAPWGKNINSVLAIVRGLLVSLLCLLLLNFFIKKTENNIQKKVVGIILDNSKSINAIGQNNISSIKTALNSLKDKLSEKEFDVEIASFSDQKNIDSIKFNVNSTNLSQLIGNFKSKNEGRNITDVILLSDGINNQGFSPSNASYPFPIHSLAIGDSTPKKDIILKNIIANNIAYKGNDFMIEAEIFAEGYDGKSTQISVYQDNKVVSTKNTILNNSTEPTIVEFKLSSNKLGLNRFLINVNPLSGENNLKNNSREVFVDIIDGQQKILLLAPAPHPDIKALKTIIEGNENYKLTANIANQFQKADMNQKFDLVILHQLPDEQGTFQNEIKNFKQSKTPIFYIIGNLSSIAALNLLDNEIEIVGSSYETDKVNGLVNENFNIINFDKSALKIVEKLPPITVPFAEYKINNEVILFQKIGNTPTKKPLLVLNNKSPKSAYFLGEGLWGWRMEEYAQTEKNEIIDDLFSKIIQQVAIKNDTRKLRISPISKEFELGQPVKLETEAYNDIFQKIYNNKINLRVTDEKGVARKYEYSNIEGNSNFQLTGLAAGIYKYLATTQIGEKTETATGEFIIKSIDYEMDNLQADYSELRKLSKNTGGLFFTSNQIGELEKSITSKKYTDKIISEDSLDELITWPWLLALILLLATIEWAARKYLGGY